MSDLRRNRNSLVIDRKALMHALWDGVTDRFDPDMEAPDEDYDWYEETVQQPVAALLCHVYGHEVVHLGAGAGDCGWCGADASHLLTSAPEQPLSTTEEKE